MNPQAHRRRVLFWIGAGALAFDVAGKMQIANDRSTSQEEAKELVDKANTSLSFADS